ncbi:MAG: sigma-54 interaction domain-containing protein [Bacillota bacterium]|nr:sigma 54-interacting transcriptional regulator [Clostridia bacterium]
MKIRDLASKDFAVYPSSRKLKEISDDIFTRNIDYVILIKGKDVLKVFRLSSIIQGLTEQENSDVSLEELRGDEKFCLLSEDEEIDILKECDFNVGVVINQGNIPFAVIDNIKSLRKIISTVGNMYSLNADPIIGYKDVFEHLEEEIIVTDRNGRVILVNPKAEKVMGLKESETVGRKLQDLVEEKVFYPSAALEVLKTKKKVNLRTTLRSGETRLSTSVPIMDKNGEIAYAICTSKNVEEIVDLNRKLRKKEIELEQKDLEIDRLHKEAFANINFIIGSKEMNNVIKTILKVAPLDSNVFIHGETGVGKEVVAKTIHYFSQRKTYPFIKINCGLIPENLLESELFGYEGGAFSGASKSGKKGKVELAQTGTLFLDEIGEIPLSLQVKLLEFLQDSEITRVGGTKRIKINTRIITATNRDLQKMVDEGTFRIDLFYRLNVVPIKIPPLRERYEDIPILAEYFLKRFNNKYNMEKRLEPEIIEEMLKYDWPGNVRELEHVMERMIVVSDSDIISVKYFDEMVTDRDRDKGKVICTKIMPYKQAKRELEKQLVTKAYKMYRTTRKAAEALEIDPSTVVKILKKYS